jgi:hypothetical protein
MPTPFTSNVFSSTYKDDFADSDNYHRILFNSGRALQARELTQMQTIIQEEIARFGRNIFKDGASVNPGGPSLNNDYEFVKISVAEGAPVFPADPTTLVGTEFTGQDSGVKARVLEAVAAVNAANPPTIYVQYTNTSGGSVGTTPVRFNAGEVIGNGTINLNIQGEDSVPNPAMGLGTKIHNSGGDFFVRGHFVFANPQGLILSKYSNNVTEVVGFKITEDIVTVTDDTALYDNQGVTPNITSPGADRYRIKLTLTTKTAAEAAGDNFVFYCSVEDGTIVDQVTGTDDYNKINDLLAQRTFEESGNYIVKRFKSSVTDGGDNTLITASSGIAYVNGYRAVNESPTTLTIPKPRNVTTDVTTINANPTAMSYGSFFIVNKLHGLLDFRTFGTINLRDAITHGGSTIGTARVRSVEREASGTADTSTFRVYLFDIVMSGSNSLRSVRSIGTAANNYADIVTEAGNAVLKQPAKTSLIFPTVYPRPKTMSDMNFTVQRIFPSVTAGSGGAVISVSATGETFPIEGASDVIVTTVNGDLIPTTASNVTITGNTQMTIANVSSGTNVNIYAKVNLGSPTLRTKTLTEVAVTKTATTSGGVTFYNLGKTDLFRVMEVRDGSSSGTDVSSRFTIDNGQRAGYYDNARLILNSGMTAPTNLYVKFKHFVHGAGDFFSVNSYNVSLGGDIAYNQIPDFKANERSSINLRDVIDLRSDINAAGTAFASADINELPVGSGQTFTADITFYNRRSDKIVITTAGELKNIKGVSGLDETPTPPTPENTLALFEVFHNPYGLNARDLTIRPVEAKRFTMKDISKLEKRVDKIEEATSLSLLELDTSSLLVLDASGNVRTKSGFFVDNFRDRTFADVQNPEYRAAIDPSFGVLQPQQRNDNITLRYDSAASTNTILKGDTIYINHTDEIAIAQTKVTGTENVNPFAVITGTGNLTMSPASDEWVDIEFAPEIIIEQQQEILTAEDGTVTEGAVSPMQWSTNNFVPVNGFGVLDINLFNGWNGWVQWNQNGTTTAPPQLFPGVGGFSPRIVTGTDIIREVIEDRELSVVFLPFVRSRKVFFKAEGLLPNTQYFPFFDGVNVSAFVKSDGEAFANFASSTSGGVEYGSEFRNNTAHPQGSSTIVTNSNGYVDGSFFIPCNDKPAEVEGEETVDTGIRFTNGDNEFKLLNISIDNEETATSRAANIYTSEGTLQTRQQTVTSTRVIQSRPNRWTQNQRVRNQDPLAQSFRVNNSAGMFVTKVDCYFKTKDVNVPVQLQIRPMVNGHPSSTDIISNAVKFMNASSVNATDERLVDGVVTPATLASQVVAIPTTFTFDEPIFLNPDTEYAIVLLAESKEYNAWVAETQKLELGSTEKLIDRQPNMGSLFKSQNGTTWEPDQTKDLMFRIHSAVFDTAGGTAIFENVEIQKSSFSFANPLFVDTATPKEVTAILPNHGFIVGDTVVFSGLSGTLGTGYAATEINGTQTITAADGFGFTFNTTNNATTTTTFGGTTLRVVKQIPYDGVIPNFTTLIPDDTSITYSAELTTGQSLAGNENRYGKSLVPNIVIGEENYFGEPKMIANRVNEVAHVNDPAGSPLSSNNKSATFGVSLTTSNNKVSPIIDAQRSSLTTISNLIDNQVASGATVGQENVPLNYVAETNAFGGSHIAKHITAVSNLTEPAVGLKVIVSAFRPVGADFDLYFRTTSEGENIYTKDWTLSSLEQSVSTDNRNFREYRFLIGGAGGTIPEFTQHQYKIVMRSNNSSAVPVFKDFRSIALAV